MALMSWTSPVVMVGSTLSVGCRTGERHLPEWSTGAGRIHRFGPEAGVTSGVEMSITVRWVLAQPELSLRLRGGADGLDREIEFAITTELPEPFPWLSGGELLLTTGLRLPQDPEECTEYLRGLLDCGVAAVGVGIGLSHAEIPEGLVA